jgi:hypothetical protein
MEVFVCIKEDEPETLSNQLRGDTKHDRNVARKIVAKGGTTLKATNLG